MKKYRPTLTQFELKKLEELRKFWITPGNQKKKIVEQKPKEESKQMELF